MKMFYEDLKVDKHYQELNVRDFLVPISRSKNVNTAIWFPILSIYFFVSYLAFLRMSLYGTVASVWDCDIVVIQFELYLRYYRSQLFCVSQSLHKSLNLTCFFSLFIWNDPADTTRVVSELSSYYHYFIPYSFFIPVLNRIFWLRSERKRVSLDL